MFRSISASLVLLTAAHITLSAPVAPQHWVASWTASIQGPYPSGNASAQPNLSLVFPVPASGARDQSFRLIVRPDIWGTSARIRLSNVFGAKPVTFDGVFAGLQMSGAALVPGTNRPVAFHGKPSVTVPQGESIWSDAFSLNQTSTSQLAGRKLAVSFHIVGESGPMTWHAKALTTSYLSPPDSGAKGNEEGEASFPNPTTSWYFLDAIDMMAPASTRAIVAFGDSITDGTASTLNGDDRWPDVLSRRVHAAYGNQFSVVNAGIGGNQVIGPAAYTAAMPFSGGPSAEQRLDRDVLSLSGVGAVIWLEGINDFSRNGNASTDAVQAGMREIAARLRAKISDVRVIGATVTSAVGYASAAPDQEEKRQALNRFIRTSGLFDGVADFDKVTLDPKTGGLRAEFVPESTTGGAGDKLHPNRLGYAAMGMSVNLLSLIPAERLTAGPPKLIAESGAREGPSWDPFSQTLYFVSGNNVNRLNQQGKVEAFRTDAVGANGSLVDPQGRVLTCEAGSRRVTRTEKDGKLTILADNFEGKKLNSPNDLALDSKGRIYFTDPRYGSMDSMEIKDSAGKSVEGVYRIDAPGRVTRILTHEVERPNGILVSPDDRYLYIADNYNNRAGGARKLWRFDLKPDGTVSSASRLLIFDWKTGRGPDGFKMDRDGRLFVAAGRNTPGEWETADEFRGGVYILSPKGHLLEFIPFEKDEITNCAFGGADLKTLFVTAGDQLWSVPMKTPGLISARR